MYVLLFLQFFNRFSLHFPIPFPYFPVRSLQAQQAVCTPFSSKDNPLRLKPCRSSIIGDRLIFCSRNAPCIPSPSIYRMFFFCKMFLNCPHHKKTEQTPAHTCLSLHAVLCTCLPPLPTTLILIIRSKDTISYIG